MIFLYILLAILLILGLVSLIPIGIEASYKNKLYCLLKIGFIKIQLFPEKKKKKKSTPQEKPVPKKKEEPKKKDAFSFKKFFKQNGVSGLMKILKKIASMAKGALKDVFSHIIIRELMLDVTIGGEDAAETAVSYGKACAVVYPSVSLITQICNCRSLKVLVSPDFTDGSDSKANCKVVADIRTFWLIKAVFVHGFKAISLLIKYKKAQEKVSPKEESSKNEK